MPGAASLAAGQYYAHPRNVFWRILVRALGGGPGLAYQARLELLKRNGIALWDVLASCVRPGSGDSDIRKASARPNDFAAFFRASPGIRRVLFNGAKAEECYKRYVLPSLPAACSSMEYVRLPSTSPAHAALTYREKYRLWLAALRPR